MSSFTSARRAPQYVDRDHIPGGVPFTPSRASSAGTLAFLLHYRADMSGSSHSETREIGGPKAPESRERHEAQRRAAARARSREQEGMFRPPVPTPSTGSTEAASRIADLAFRALAENVRDYAIFLMDPDGVITFWGEGARLMKWWTKDEAEGSHLRLLYPDGGSDDGTAEGHLIDAAEHGEYSGEGRRVRSDGSLFWAGITLTALRDEHGELLGFAKVTRDLTARRAADALLQSAAEAAEEARAAAEAANRAKSGFLATMSHEIRTPVNAILGYYDLLDLEIGGKLTAEQRRYIERAGASGRHLLTLIDEVLDFSRIEADRVTVGSATFRLGDAVRGAIALIEPLAQDNGVGLVDAVAGTAAELFARGDEGRVRQILVNLMTNAVKFSSTGGRITVSAGMAEEPSPDAVLTGDGPWAYIRVEDLGSGIPADRLEAVFEPFVQADMTLTRQHGGTGLGLAISRRLARLMGGDLTVRSEVNVGSTFFLWLAAAPAESVRMGGMRGAGAASDATFNEENQEIGQPGTLRAVGDALRGQIERILHAYVARLRTDPETPSAHRLAEKELEDHLATFLADVTQTLGAMSAMSGDPTGSLRDGTAIQRVVAARHGAQRARLGWSEEEVRREFAILGDELAAAARRYDPVDRDGGARDDSPSSLLVLEKFLEYAESVSVESLRAARSSTPN
jgi:PAS domain S-box-containing protein